MHTFCQFCISQWKKNKVECPICRAPIKTEGRSFVIDSAIDGIVSTLSEEMQQRRKELIQQRREIAIQTANNQDHKSTLATARSRGSRGGRQPARGPGIIHLVCHRLVLIIFSMDIGYPSMWIFVIQLFSVTISLIILSTPFNI